MFVMVTLLIKVFVMLIICFLWMHELTLKVSAWYDIRFGKRVKNVKFNTGYR